MAALKECHHKQLLTINGCRDQRASANNTVGFRSCGEAAAYALGKMDNTVALASETMFMYTAYFVDDDPIQGDGVM